MAHHNTPKAFSATPATQAVAVTPNDSNDLAITARALFVGTAGDVQVTPADGSAAVIFKNCQSGSVLPVEVKRVWVTNTSALNLVAVW